jgi:hypothetical protein
MCSFGFPDICGFYDMLYGAAGVDLQAITCLQFGGASGMVFPGNPPFTVTDFIGVYSKFVGPNTNLSGITITAGSNVITGLTAAQVASLATGQLVVSSLIPPDSVITALGSFSITVTNPATGNGSSLTVYTGPFIPIVVLLNYVYLANASVKQGRYCEAWFMQMCYFVAHYATLFMRSESGTPNITATQVASSGLTKGIIISRQAGDVSARSQLIQGYEEWGAWGETQYGELFITIARATAMGPIWVP